MLGIELGRDIGEGKVRQGEAECLLFGHRSQFPYVQTVTDLRRGGIAFYNCEKPAPAGGPAIVGHFIVGMPEFWAFVQGVVDTTPGSCGKVVGGAVVLPQELSFTIEHQEHKRRKIMPQPKAAANGGVQQQIEFEELIARMERTVCRAEHDVAELGDLTGFAELEGDGRECWVRGQRGGGVPSYIV